MAQEKKYHINSKREVKPCQAEKRACRFAAASHFADEAQAQRAVEEMNAAESGEGNLHTSRVAETDADSSDNGTTDDITGVSDADENAEQVDSTPKRSEYTFNRDSLDHAVKFIDKANKRLAAAGIEDRFEYDVEEFKERRKTPSGRTEEFDRVRLTLDKPTISYQGYEFQARVEQLDSGTLIAYPSPGVELKGWRPESMECQQCHKNIHRSKVYLVKGPDGEMKTVGGKCVELYTGLEPKGLWTLGAELDDSLGNQNRAMPTGGGQLVDSTDDLLALSYAVTKERGYHNAHSDHPTRYEIEDIMYPSPGRKRSSEEIEHADRMTREARNVDTKALRAEIREALKHSDSDYAENLRTLMDEEYIPHRRMGLLASALSVVHKKREEKKQTAQYASGFLGEKGEKIEDVRAKVESIRYVQENYGYRPQTAAMITMKADSGHKVFWKTSSTNVPDEGDSITFSGGVKSQDTFKGVDSTRIVRAKWKHDEDADNGDTD